jgi:hypothetical protein
MADPECTAAVAAPQPRALALSGAAAYGRWMRLVIAAIAVLTLSAGVPNAGAAQAGAASSGGARGVTMSDANACAALLDASLPAVDGATVRVASSRVVPAGALPAHCRIEGTVSATIAFVLRVPVAWNRKLLFQGCRALCGYQATADCDDALARGYAALTTDTGHVASLIDASWAAGNPQARTDYEWRAVHLVASAGKSLVATLRGERPVRTYLRGCSNGGRQGLLEAERYPDTFDGIVAGAPLMPGDGLLHLAWSARAVLDDARRPELSRADLVDLHAAVLRACGDVHGYVPAPADCAIDVREPAFGRGTPVERWSMAKRAAAQRVYDGPRRRDGTPLTAGAPMPGSELAWTSFVPAPGERSIFESLATDYLRHLAFDVEPSPVADVFALDFDRDVPAVVSTASRSRPTGDLRAFAARGGKVIVYHGWADESVVPANSIAYARRVRAALGDSATNAALRLYMLPGVGHCSETPGAGRVDWLAALEDWVEHGRAPGPLTGTGGDGLSIEHSPYDAYRTGAPRR